MANDPFVQPQIVAKPNLKTGSSGKAIASLMFGLASFFCAFFTGIIAIILGILALGDISKSQGRLQGNGLAIAGIITGAIGCFWTLILIALLLPAVQATREAARRTVSMNNIKHMTLGMHNYESSYGSLPIVKGGKGQGLSWRVHILPFIEEQGLYDQFHLDEPWDSPHNLTLVDQMPRIFENPNLMHNLGPGQTTYLIPTTPADADPSLPHAVFIQGRPGPSMADIIDGMSNTILIVEADPDAAVTWTDPNGDWAYDPGDPMRSLGHVRPGVIVTGFADGSARSVDNGMSPQNFNALITRDGGETVQY